MWRDYNNPGNWWIVRLILLGIFILLIFVGADSSKAEDSVMLNFDEIISMERPYYEEIPYGEEMSVETPNYTEILYKLI